MTGRIWLIVEDKNDAKIIRTILEKKGYRVVVESRNPSGDSGGIGRLANQLTKLIDDVRSQSHFNKQTDCIAVVHDQDKHTQPNRVLYQKIEDICTTEGVKRILAMDELEAWLLADSGICEWLDKPQKNWDEQRKPSEQLNSFMNDAYKKKYKGDNRGIVLEHVKGDGDKHSPSMRGALQFLIDAPCISTKT